jgi:GNAT superfamily N-acetyltransferase
MRFTVWGKEEITQLSDLEKEHWFDVLNNGLEKDRNISLDNPKILEFQENIKKEYLKYLHECTRTAYYFSYFVLYNEEDIMVSVCRVMEMDHQFYLEGLETHRDYYRKGYASALVNEVILYLKEIDISTLRSSVSTSNLGSIQFHKFLGFAIYDENENKVRFQFDIMGRPRHLSSLLKRLWLIHLIWGLPYHKDNNRRYYKSSYGELIVNLILVVVLIDIVYYFTLSNHPVEFILSNVFLLFFSNILNGIRYFKNKDTQYREIVIKLAVSSTLIIACSTIIVILIQLVI